MHILTNLADKLSELVQVALAIWSDTQFSDTTVELFCPFKWVLYTIKKLINQTPDQSLEKCIDILTYVVKEEKFVINLLIWLIFSFPEEPDVFDKPGLDVLIVHELTENVELLSEELISKVYLNRN